MLNLPGIPEMREDRQVAHPPGNRSGLPGWRMSDVNAPVSLARLERMTGKLDKAKGVSVDFMQQQKDVREAHPVYKGGASHYED